MTDDALRCSSQDLDDEDSLFGSPPPSPSASLSTTIEREKSPALALPTSGSGASRFSTSTATGLQNVGTIALPGSHHDIELPMTPIALSLNHNVVTRPPALPGTYYQKPNGPIAIGGTATSQNATSSTGVSSSNAIETTTAMSRDSPATTGTKPRPKSKKTHKRSRSSKESTPQPRVEFELPDPSEPLPAHFLRNQDKLLGVAGLVGGVRPAAITHVRGTSASNPIIVDDDEDAPRLGRRPVQTKELFLPTRIDPSLLEAPSNEEIVSVLIRQKDIFPVLQSILKLIAPQNKDNQRRPFSQTSNRNSFSSPSAQPPQKKRKLNRVPAGAADWDVPYPFAQGEGPEEYRQTWERERSKQLITQLVKLIKTAAVKAATKKYVQKVGKRREQEQRARREADPFYTEHSPPTHTTDNHHNIVFSKEANNTPTFPSNFPTPSDVSNLPPSASTTLPSVTGPNTSSAAFDHLISSLVAAQPHETPCSNPPPEQSPDPSNIASPASQSQAPIDQSLFDSWMDILQAFPVQFDGGSSSDPSHLTIDTSFDMNFGSGMDSHDLGLGGGLDAFGLPISTPLSNSGSTTPFAEIAPTVPSADELKAMASTMGDLPVVSPTPAPDVATDTVSLIDDHLIDPQLVMLSMPPLTSDVDASTGTVSQPDNAFNFPVAMDLDRLSPLTSATASSSGGTGPTTPASAAWDFSMPDFLNSIGTNSDAMMVDEGGSAGIKLDALSLGGSSHRIESTTDELAPNVDKVKGKEPMSNFSGLGDKNHVVGSTTPITSQIRTSTLEDTVFQSLFRRPPLFTPTVPLPTSGASSVASIPTVTSTSNETVADKKLKREDILKRAKEKRQKLQEELNKVKTQLWETTVEQAGLVNLLKKLDDWEHRSCTFQNTLPSVEPRPSTQSASPVIVSDN